MGTVSGAPGSKSEHPGYKRVTMKVFLVLFIIGTVFVIDGHSKGPVEKCKGVQWRGKLTKAKYQCGADNEPHFHMFSSGENMGEFKIGPSQYFMNKDEGKRGGVCCRLYCDLGEDRGGKSVQACLTCMRQMASEVLCKDFWAGCKC